MTEDINKEEILNIIQQQQNNQNIETNLEDMLKALLLNPSRMSTERTQLIDNLHNGVISEIKEGSVLNASGFIEDIKQENIFMLDDGTSLGGIVKCQTCSGIVKLERLKDR